MKVARSLAAANAILALGACLVVWSQADAESTAHWGYGYHGGYYLTDADAYRRCLDRLFELLRADPQMKVVLELEPYTLEAMKHGERFECERVGRDKPRVVGWNWPGQGADRSPQAAHDGDYGVRLANQQAPYVNLCQPLDAVRLRGQMLTFSGWVRAARGEGVQLYIDAWSDAGYIAGSSVKRSVPPDGKWHSVSMAFRVPADAKTIFPQAKIEGIGQADFDELSLIDEAGRQLLRNGSFETTSVPTLRDRKRLAELRHWIERGQIEIVGGAYTQPILYTIGSEAAARQFSVGMQAVRDTLGIDVGIYAAQEPDMCGQIPQLLRSCGIDRVLYRTHWCIFGSPPHRNAEIAWWIGPDGTRVRAIPAYEFTPLRNYGLPGRPTMKLLSDADAAGIDNPLFTMFADLVDRAIPDETQSITRGSLSEGWVNLCRRIDVRHLRGKRLQLSARLRARKPGAHLYIDAHTADGRAVGGVQSQNVPADDAWHRADLSFTVPENAVDAFPQVRIIAPEGDLDIADVELVAAADGAEVLPGPMIADGRLADGWSVGASSGVTSEADVREHNDESWVRITSRAPTVPTKVTTLGDYFELSGEPQQNWADAYAGFEHRFPWGLLAGRPQKWDQQAVNAVTGAERMLAVFDRPPTAALEDAWRLALMQEHHDGWVCAPVSFGIWRTYETYAQMCKAAAREAREICARITDDITASSPGRALTVVNLCGRERTQVVPFEATLPEGALTRPCIVGTDGSPSPAEITVSSRHDDGCAEDISGRFVATAPAMGYRRYQITDSRAIRQPTRNLPESELRLSCGDRGLLQVVSAQSEASLLPGPLRLAGSFSEGERFDEQRGVTHQPNSAALTTDGRIGPITYHCIAEPSRLAPLVRLWLTLDFGDGVNVGATDDSPGLPKWAKTDKKLRLVVPLPFEAPTFYAHGPFEVRPVRPGRYHIIRYAIAQGAERGIAVFSDRATDVVFRPEDPAIELALGYGGGFIYAPDQRAPLTGKATYEIALLFYDNHWSAAQVPAVAQSLAHPMIAVAGPIRSGPAELSRVAIEPRGAAVLTAMWPRDDGCAVRLWRPYPGQAEVRVTVSGARRLATATIDGKPQSDIADGATATLALRHNEILTLSALIPSTTH